MKKYDWATVQLIFWVGAITLFILSLVVGFVWGFWAQLPLIIMLGGWGVFVRRCLSKE